MPSEPSRRRLLGGVAAAVSVGLGAGCLGSDAPELRVRNNAGHANTIHVEITSDADEYLHDSEYALPAHEQATEDEVYDSAGTYTITATVNDETTSNEITVDDPDDVITHATVRDDGDVNAGRLGRP